jgi:ubiquinone/menaquinone biosynthesis C-methylase UbiE
VFREAFRVLVPNGIFMHTDFGIQKKIGSIGNLSFNESLRLFSFLYFNIIETLLGNFMKTVLDNFTGITFSLIKMVGFNEVQHLRSKFKKAVFIKAIK